MLIRKKREGFVPIGYVDFWSQHFTWTFYWKLNKKRFLWDLLSPLREKVFCEDIYNKKGARSFLKPAPSVKENKLL